MTHLTSDLEGAELDYWVAKANGDLRNGHYSTNWAHSGPIIERERIWLTALPAPSTQWTADIPGEPGDPYHPPAPGAFGSPGHVKATATGSTPLIAAMRCFVSSKYGETVPEQETRLNPSL